MQTAILADALGCQLRFIVTRTGGDAPQATAHFKGQVSDAILADKVHSAALYMIIASTGVQPVISSNRRRSTTPGV